MLHKPTSVHPPGASYPRATPVISHSDTHTEQGDSQARRKRKKALIDRSRKNPITEMKEAAQAYVSRLWIIRPASSHYFPARLSLSLEGAVAEPGPCACLPHLSPGEQSTWQKQHHSWGENIMEWRWMKERRRKQGDKGGEKEKPIPGEQTNQNHGIK